MLDVPFFCLKGADMGLFSGLFGGSKRGNVYSGKNPPQGFIDAAKFGKTKGGFAGGYGAWTFGNIIRAHSSAEDIVDEFGLNQQDSPYGNCYARAYRECKQEAMIKFLLAGGLLLGMDISDFIDWGEVEDLAYEYAIELAESYINGDVWIPIDILEWAYYDVSDHNG